MIESVTVVGRTTNAVVTPEALEKYQANDLADIFRHTPSISVGGSLGIAQKIYLRGLEDTLLNVTVDGAPQTSTLFHHIGRVSIEPELLKEVEVQTGAGEATSGAGAIGGAIRFVTKSANELLREEQQFGALVKAGYFSNDGYRGSASVYGNLNDNWGLLGSHVFVDRNNQEDGDGNEMFGTAAEQSLSFIKLNGRLSDSQQLSLSYELRQDEGKFGARPNWPTLQGDTLFPMDAKRQTFVANHRVNANDLVNLETSAYHTESELEQNRFDRWGLYGANIVSYGLDVRNTSLLGQHSVTYGIDYRRDEVESQYLADSSVWADWTWDPDIGQFAEESQVSGIYVQDHWQLTDAVLLSYGVRYDHYELDQVTYSAGTSSDGFSPNIGLEYNFAHAWTATLGYAEALRGKEIGDAFTLEKRPGRISLAPGLEPETAANTEAGLEYQQDNLTITAAIYHTEIDDVIQDQIGSNASPLQDATFYENIGTLTTEGFELSANYQWQDLNLIASYTTNDSDINGNTVEGYEHIGLANASGDSWNLSLVYAVTESLEFGWDFTYVESLDDIEVLQRAVELEWIDSTQTVDKPDYQVHDVYVQWQPLRSDTLTLNLAIQNLFNEQYRDHSSVADYNHIPDWQGVAGLYEAGRDIRLSAAYKF